MAAPGMPLLEFGLFSDEVYTSTDLNRRSAEVLNRANKIPVTIARNNERFALLRRDQAASLVKGIMQLSEVVQVARGALALRSNAADQVPASVAWMKVFDEEDRFTMLSEILSAASQASAGGDWDSVGDLIHQWHESAMVAESGVLKAAEESSADEQPLTNPSDLAERPEVVECSSNE